MNKQLQTYRLMTILLLLLFIGTLIWGIANTKIAEDCLDLGYDMLETSKEKTQEAEFWFKAFNHTADQFYDYMTDLAESRNESIGYNKDYLKIILIEEVKESEEYINKDE